MKHFYSIVSLLSIFLFVGTSCEDDYRDIVLFEGVEPIYQIGTCDNLISYLTLYLTNPDGAVLGIDGGDGAYSLEGGDDAVASVVFSEDLNGYRRIKVKPVGEGVTNVVVKDGNGGMTMLKVVVKDCYKFRYFVQQVGYFCSDKLEENLWNQIQVDLTATMTMKQEGYYTLIPSEPGNLRYGGGKLLVHASAMVSGFMEGTYETVELEEGKFAFRFSYNDEVHDFAFEPLGLPTTQTDSMSPMTVYEDVTSLVTAPLPEGCRVYRLEKWMYFPDEIMTNQR